MNHVRITCLVAAFLVSACTSTSQTGTEVTRYHLDQPIPPQTATIEITSTTEGSNTQIADYTEIVAAQLAALGFSSTEPEDADLVAMVNVRKYTQDKLPTRSPVSIGIGGGSYGGNMGVGAGATIPVGSQKGGLVNVIELKVDLLQRRDDKTVWEGTAVRTLAPGIVDRSAVVTELAAALFKDFPGKSGKTVSVK